MRAVAVVLVLFAAGVLAGGGEVSFAAKPAVTKAGDNYKIDFALSAATDVEVAVLDSAGKIVRHLAAGVLGAKNPPPEPLKAGLAQSLEWDGRDDLGKPAAGGPFKVRVRAGMSVKFGKILGTSPYTGTLVNDSLAVAADGTLYIKMASYVGGLHEGIPWHLRRFDKTGKYQKTLLPYPPSTPADKVPGFQLVDAGDGLLTPVHTSGLDVVLFRFGDNIYPKVVDGNVIFIDNGSARLTFFKADGSNAVKVVPMRTAPDKLKWPGWLAPQLAFSPDGKYAYYSNVANTPYDANVHPSKMDQKFPQGRVYRQNLTAPGANPEKFYDLELPDWERTKYWLPSAWDKKTAAAGVDVDTRGNLFVCDLVNQEVVELSPEGKKLGAVKVPWPDKVLVSSKTGTLYVVSCAVSDGFRPPATLLKITGRGAEAREAAKFPLKGGLGQTMALDESGEAVALWLGGGGEVLRVEDRGAELAVAGANFLNPKDAIGFVCYGDVDAEADLVYITQGMGPVWRYSGETGDGGLAPIKACDLAVGPGGLIYAWGDTGSYAGPVTRYSRDYKPAPLASTGKHTYGNLACRYGRGNSVAGLDVDPRGWVYATNGGNSCHVQAYDTEGKPVQFERQGAAGPVLVGGMTDQSGSIRVDAGGNVYLLQLGPPKGPAPKGFEKDPAYLRATGTIYKFGPKGGDFQKGQAVGALRSYGAASGPISGAWASTQSVCHCTKPRFDLDGYGRLYVPNGVTYKVTVLDNADNPILSFGGYGNWDAQGPASSEPKPEIPLGWPIVAGASDKHVYVGDGLNHRVVRADKTWKAEETGEAR